jgi:hypothetical protein
MKKLIALFILISLCTACNRKTFQSVEKTTITKDSIIVVHDTLILHDTTFVFKGDSSQIQAQVIVDKNGKAELPQTITETPRLKSIVSITNGVMKVDCICKELEQTVQLQERRITELTRINEKQKTDIQTTKTVEVKYIPKFVSVLAWLGGLTWLGIIIWAVAKLYLKFKPL